MGPKCMTDYAACTYYYKVVRQVGWYEKTILNYCFMSLTWPKLWLLTLWCQNSIPDVTCRRLEFVWKLHKEAIKWPLSIPFILNFEHHAAWQIYHPKVKRTLSYTQISSELSPMALSGVYLLTTSHRHSCQPAHTNWRSYATHLDPADKDIRFLQNFGIQQQQQLHKSKSGTP